MFKNLFTTLFFLAVLSVSSFASGGNTYELKEQDLITEIESKAPELEAKIEKQKEKIKEKIKNFSGELLSVAKENKTRYIDPTFTLDKDIPRYNKLGHQDGWRVDDLCTKVAKLHRLNVTQFVDGIS
jgi:conjugal transfer pilus assembly protein TraW